MWRRWQLNYSKAVYKKRNWYIAHELLYFHTDKARSRAKAPKLVVWENLVLIKAKNPDEAYRKALKHGCLSEEQVRINGESGRCRFRGLKDLVLIYDDLEDGTELEWHDLRLNAAELSRMVRRKQQMQAFHIGPGGRD